MTILAPLPSTTAAPHHAANQNTCCGDALAPRHEPITSPSSRPRRLGLVLSLIMAVVLCVGCKELNPFRSGSFGSGTPDPGPDRGTVLFTAVRGNFTVNVRQYTAGKDGNETIFCDYWVRYKGKPVTSDVDLNGYNSCKALLILDEAEDRIVVGAIASSQGEYVPVFFAERNGTAIVTPRPDCALTSHNDERQQYMNGWAVQDGAVTICNERLKVVPLVTSDIRPPVQPVRPDSTLPAEFQQTHHTLEVP